jgi:LuxR family maltose regulon positive regulatory protein
MGGAPSEAGDAGSGVLPRTRLVELIRSTPPGGTCLLLAEPGHGRRTVVDHAVGVHAATIALPPRAVEEVTWRALLDDALLGDRDAGIDNQGALRSTQPTWVVVLDVDPVLHVELLPHLVEFAERCPTSLRLVVTSSPALRPAFSRLRPGGRLVELDGDDLALAPEESRALLRTLAPDLDDDSVEDVVALCDGWVAALRSTARQCQTHPDRDVLTWLRTQGAEAAFGPWLDSVGADTSDILLDTAILDQLHPGLVDAVCGAGGHQLSTLASPGGPLHLAAQPLTDEGLWFERHPLLTAALRFLAAGRPGEATRHRHAADWLLAQGLVTVELEHRLLAGDAAGAIDRFHRHEDDLLESGLTHLALRWYRALPESGLAPQDLLREAWAYALSGRVPESRRSLDRLRLALRSESRSHPSLHPELPDLDAEADVLEAWLAEQDGDLVRMLRCSTRAQVSFGGAWTSNSRQAVPLFRARAALHLGDVATAEQVLDGVRDEPFLSGTLGEGRRAATESELAWVRGEVIRARSWAARLDRWLRDQARGGAADEWIGGSTGGHLARAEGGEPQQAIDALLQLIEHARDITGSATAEVLARLGLASVLGTHTGPGAGLEQLDSARDVVLRRSPDGGLLPLVATLEARFRLAAGDPRRAEQLLRGLSPSTSRQLLLARAALQRRLPTAPLSVRAITPTTPREESTLALLQAWTALRGSRERAEQQLIRAADLCAEHGMTTLLVDVPEPLLEFARRTASYHVHDPLMTLVATAERIRSKDDGRLAVVSGASDTAALSRGDLQLLGMLPARASNARIAEQLGISVNTVKTRLRRLYAKLGAHDRDDAVARARAAGLLPGGTDVTR